MLIKSSILGSAISGLLLASAGVAVTGLATPAFADDSDMEQCAGVIRAGKNDCATSTNACHGHVKEDGNQEAWIYLPKGTCDKIANATIVHVADPTPKDNSPAG